MGAPDWPRMMKKQTAALYCDLSAIEFESEVALGRLPLPFRLGKADHWDREQIDEELNRLSGRKRDWRSEQPGLVAQARP